MPLLFGYNKITTPTYYLHKNIPPIFTNSKHPFFKTLNEEGTINEFMKALCKKTDIDPKVYFSKKFMSDINIEDLRVFFGFSYNYKYLKKTPFARIKKGCYTNSILLLNNDESKNSIVHIHVIKEPDLYGFWKIFGIEKD